MDRHVFNNSSHAAINGQISVLAQTASVVSREPIATFCSTEFNIAVAQLIMTKISAEGTADCFKLAHHILRPTEPASGCLCEVNDGMGERRRS